MVNISIRKSLYYTKYMNMLACMFIRSFVKILSVVLFLLTIFLLIAVMLKWIGMEWIDGFTVMDFTKTLFAVVTLLVANLQISRYLEQYAVDSIVKLRDNFNEEPMRLIQQKLITADATLFENTDTILLFNFLGYIEVGSIMLQSGVMTREQFRNQFKYILGRVISNQSYVEHIILSASCYDDLLFVIRLEFPEVCVFDE